MNKLLIVLFISVSLSAQNLKLGGLEFNSRDLPLDRRTSLDLTRYKNIDFTNDFSLEFFISFRSTKFMGPIYRITSTSFNSELLFVQYLNPDSVYLKLINNDSVIVQLPLPKNLLLPSKWIKVKVDYLLSRQIVRFSFMNFTLVAKQNKMPSEFNGKLVFGRRPFFGSDTPKMNIADIKLLIGNKISNHWVLDELFGNNAYDSEGNTVGFVENPNWLTPKQYHWRKITEVGPFNEIPNSEDEGVNILFSDKSQRLLFISENHLFVYDIISGKLWKEKFLNRRVQVRTNQIWNEIKNVIHSQYSGQGKVVDYDLQTRKWGSIDTVGEFQRRYYGHNLFVDPSNGSLFMMNGYGWYRTNNELQKYNYVKANWEKIPLRGDYLKPRRDAAIGKYDEVGKFLIFGGSGNTSGKQEDGFKNLYDLYLLDLKDSSLKKIWEFENFDENLLPLYNIYRDIKDNTFYVAMAKISTVGKYKRLYKFSSEKPEFTIVGDSVGGGDINWHRGVYFSSYTNKFYITSKIKKSDLTYSLALYELLSPPMSEKEYFGLKAKQMKKDQLLFSNKTYVFSLILIASASIVIIILFVIRKKKIKKGLNYSNTQNIEKFISQNHCLPNSIYLFGNFQVNSADGKEITNEFTPKLRQLFTLLLIKSYNGNSSKLTTEELSTILWPDYSTEQLKNNRNVYISKLRAILNKLNKIEVVNEKNSWELKFSNEIYCDYLEFINLCNSKMTINDIPKLQSIVSRGEILKDVNFDWFESQKIYLIATTIANLKKILLDDNIDNSYRLLISNCILHLDSVNEDGLHAKIKALIQSGDHSLAKTSFEVFKKEYFTLYAEEYSKTFSDFCK